MILSVFVTGATGYLGSGMLAEMKNCDAVVHAALDSDDAEARDQAVG